MQNTSAFQNQNISHKYEENKKSCKNSAAIAVKYLRK